jgi:hypothetical protein
MYKYKKSLYDSPNLPLSPVLLSGLFGPSIKLITQKNHPTAEAVVVLSLTTLY